MKKLALLIIAILMATPVMAKPMSSVSTLKMTEFPQAYQFVIDYDSRTDGQPVYLGYADNGLGTDATGWIMFKFTYDVNDQVLTRKAAYGIWDDRATLTFE